MSRASTTDAELDFAAVAEVASSSATPTGHRIIHLVGSGASTVAVLLVVVLSIPTPSAPFSAFISEVAPFIADERKGV